MMFSYCRAGGAYRPKGRFPPVEFPAGGQGPPSTERAAAIYLNDGSSGAREGGDDSGDGGGDLLGRGQPSQRRTRSLFIPPGLVERLDEFSIDQPGRDRYHADVRRQRSGERFGHVVERGFGSAIDDVAS